MKEKKGLGQKLGLGTAQFGSDYGINNQAGKPPKEKAFKILSTAAKNGVEVVDTAYSYNDSETVIGEFIKKKKPGFRVVSKMPGCQALSTSAIFNSSLERLGLKSVYAYLLHDFECFLREPVQINTLLGFKQQGLIQKVGFSVYFPKDAEYLLENEIEFDLIQIPYSVFDQRFSEVLERLKDSKVEVHARSVFLQGLAFKDPEKLKGRFLALKEKLSELNSISKKTGIPVNALCINFAALNRCIDTVIVGVDSPENLEENIKALSLQRKARKAMPGLLELREDDEKIIVPTNWKVPKK